jgi:hypothetical protein
VTTPDPRPDEAPAVRHLHAAYLVKHVFGNDPVAEALVLASYASLRTGGLYDEASLVRAQQLLEDLGLISRTGRKLQATEELARLHLLPDCGYMRSRGTPSRTGQSLCPMPPTGC